MTPDDWKKVESSLSSPYGLGVHLDCDGYKLTLQVAQVKALRYVIQIYVDGFFKGAWCSAKNPCEEQRRFMRRVDRALHKPKDLAALKRVFSAKQLREMAAKRYTYFEGHWPSFAPLKRHLVANNKDIKRVEEFFSPATVRAAAAELSNITEALK